MAIICVSTLNQVIRKKQQPRSIKGFKIHRNNNNLVCPECGVHVDRKDVKIWGNEYNCGECPCCYKNVKFDSVNPRGPRGGRDYYESKNKIDTTISSERINSLEDHLKATTGVENPLSYLKSEEIAQFTEENLGVVYSICGRKWPIGRPSKQFIACRIKILEAIMT